MQFNPEKTKDSTWRMDSQHTMFRQRVGKMEGGQGEYFFSNHESRRFSVPEGALHTHPLLPPPPPTPPFLLSFLHPFLSIPPCRWLTVKRCDYHRSVLTEPISRAPVCMVRATGSCPHLRTEACSGWNRVRDPQLLTRIRNMVTDWDMV